MLDSLKRSIVQALGGVIRELYDDAINAMAKVMEERDEFITMYRAAERDGNKARGRADEMTRAYNQRHADATAAENKALALQDELNQLSMQYETQKATIEELASENMKILAEAEAYMNNNPPMAFVVNENGKRLDLECIIGTGDNERFVVLRSLAFSSKNQQTLTRVVEAIEKARNG